ncbi:TadE/TadG family type IV pilus assembly protein [Pseudodesulfovibrio sp. zrk46]|uniref:TadE/TadG family type IV pilus assembly protein n=1 Tax=Pseudodesulfovibrio sp. zrk46 TaxID=2725288 RepID=UPI001449FA47|nr:TadE/TadG family type IV pilus assembly protein [Pseudodesulfovibrio sp. zrk46]QJB55228.1 pilus assembly protein [Pseudodesulfovibrio sp. zrk46]
MKNQKQRIARQGITSMEFAMVLPFVVTLVFGLVEFGNMFYSWLAVQKAAQVATRFAATGVGEEEGTRISQINQIAADWLADLDNGSKEIVISSWPTPAASGAGAVGSAGDPCGLVQVAVVYNYEPFTPIVSSILPTTVSLHGQDRKLNEPWKPCDN